MKGKINLKYFKYRAFKVPCPARTIVLFLFLGGVIGTFFFPHFVQADEVDTSASVLLLSAPTNLTATVISSNQIDLDWSSVSEAVSYKVYRDSALIASPVTTSYSDTGLNSATTYSYTVAAVNINGSESSQSSSVSATTAGTTAGGGGMILAPVSTTGQGNISQNLGGAVRKTFDSGKMVKIVFPSNSIKGTVVVKIEPLNKEKVIKDNPIPRNTQIIGDLVADLKVLSSGKELESFEREVSITFTYTDEQVQEAGINENTLKIYFWDEKAFLWQALPSSKVNTNVNTVTAHTLHLTLFAVMGEISVKPTIEMIINEIRAQIAKIATKIAVLKVQIKQIFTQVKSKPLTGQEKAAVVEIPKISPKEIISSSQEKQRFSIEQQAEKLERDREEIKPPLNIFQRFWQKVTNFWRKIFLKTKD